MATLTSVNGGEWSMAIHPPLIPSPSDQGTGEGRQPQCREMGCMPRSTRDPLMLVGLSCHLLCFLFECDLPPKKRTLSRIRSLCLLYLLPQTDQLASISAYEPPQRSPGPSPRCGDAEQGVVSTDFCIPLPVGKCKQCGMTRSLCYRSRQLVLSSRASM